MNKNLESKALRDGFGDEIVELAAENNDIWVVNADLEGSLRVDSFKDKFPERFVQVGVAEQVMAGVGTGLALSGKVPFITSFAAFSPGVNWSQIRLAAMSEANLKIVSSHYGLNAGEDGASAQMLSDIALMRVLPGVTVLSPADYNQTRLAVRWATKHKGMVYIRVTRSKFPIFTSLDDVYDIHRAVILKEGKDITLVATGSVVYNALKAAEELENAGKSVEVINLYSIKPLDHETVAKSLEKTGRLVTVEEHQVAGGMGSAVLESLAQHHPKLNFEAKLHGIYDHFGESGDGMELMAKYKLDLEGIGKQLTLKL